MTLAPKVGCGLRVAQAAYFKLVLIWHPDKYKGDEPDVAKATFLRVTRRLEPA